MTGLDRPFSFFFSVACKRTLTGKWQTAVVRTRRISLKSARLLQSPRSYVRFCLLWINVNDAVVRSSWNGGRASTPCPKLVADVSFIMRCRPLCHPDTMALCAPSFSPPDAHIRIVPLPGEEQSEMSVLHAAHQSLKSLGPCVGDPPNAAP